MNNSFHASQSLRSTFDVRKDTIAVAIACPERQGEVRFYGNISSAQDAVIRLMKKLIKLHGTILVCDEAAQQVGFSWRLRFIIQIK
jgi:hypothetical protein